MGVAHGIFRPLRNYSLIKAACNSNHADKTHLKISVRTMDDMAIPATAVSILDFSKELGSECLELNVLGNPYPLYAQLFPNHVEAYEARWYNRRK